MADTRERPYASTRYLARLDQKRRAAKAIRPDQRRYDHFFFHPSAATHCDNFGRLRRSPVILAFNRTYAVSFRICDDSVLSTGQVNNASLQDAKTQRRIKILSVNDVHARKNRVDQTR